MVVQRFWKNFYTFFTFVLIALSQCKQWEGYTQVYDGNDVEEEYYAQRNNPELETREDFISEGRSSISLGRSEQEERFQPNWHSLDSRKLPRWYEDAKFGIFVHWGVYSVPAFSSEWLWWYWKGDAPDEKVVDFMEMNYPSMSYQDLAPKLSGRNFAAEEWASLVEDSGAKYFVFTSKHHEGFTHWKSDESWNWNSVDIGPKRDVVDDLKSAFDATDVRFGLYFSLYEWFNPWYKRDKRNEFTTNEFVRKKIMPQLRDLVNRYEPEYIWSDGDWEAKSRYWNSTNFLAWLYNDSPVKDSIVVNDRWGKDANCHHGDVKTCKDRYHPGKLVKYKWENAMTIDKDSWGYRYNANISRYYTTAELVKILIETVSYGGNLLMNVGPTADGLIPAIFQDRLRGMGEWLKVNGQAIYNTRPWRVQQEKSKKKDKSVWYTRKADEIPLTYAMIVTWPDTKFLYLHHPKVQPGTFISLLGCDEKITWYPKGEKGLKINIEQIHLGKLASAPAWVFAMRNVE